jgi:hypothetical protein
MALLVDGRISTVSDLQTYDTGVLEAAAGAGIDLEGKLGLAEQEILTKLTAFLLRHSTRAPMAQGAPDLSAVVVTPPLRRWHALQTLLLVYGDAFHGQINDRYEGKVRYFEDQARKAAEAYFETGVGIVSDPIQRARPPAVVAGGVGPAGSAYAVSIAWRNSRNEQGSLSNPVNVISDDGEGFHVTATEPAANVVAFDVFAGHSEAEMSQQNEQPVAIDAAWSLPPTGLRAGAKVGDGQQADYWIRHERVLRRG